MVQHRSGNARKRGCSGFGVTSVVRGWEWEPERGNGAVMVTTDGTGENYSLGFTLRTAPAALPSREPTVRVFPAVGVGVPPKAAATIRLCSYPSGCGYHGRNGTGSRCPCHIIVWKGTWSEIFIFNLMSAMV